MDVAAVKGEAVGLLLAMGTMGFHDGNDGFDGSIRRVPKPKNMGNVNLLYIHTYIHI